MQHQASSSYAHFGGPTPYMSGPMPIESSSLIYTLESNDLCFTEFALIIRDLHCFKVKAFEDNSDGNQVVVHLLYNASMKNVRAKLGDLPVSVTKCNPFIQPDQIKTVEKLRLKYKFGNLPEEEEPEAPVTNKKRKYAKVPKPVVQVSVQEHK